MVVSVIIPSYNHVKYVTHAIECVLNQNWPDIDLIVIDDGSGDGSVDVIKKFHSQRGGFRFVARENRGVIRTLNEGLQMAEGEVVCFCASDDFLPPESIRKRAEFLKEHPSHVAVFADGLQVSDNDAHGETMMDEKRRRLFQIDDPVPEFIRGTNLFIHTMMARLDIFKEIGGFDERYWHCEDLDVQLLLFLNGRVGYVDRTVYCYRRHGANISSRGSNIARVDKVLCYRKYLEEVCELVPYRKLIRYCLRRQYLLLGRHLRKKGVASPQELEVLRGGWEFAWLDLRLLWVLLWFQWRKGPKSICI